MSETTTKNPMNDHTFDKALNDDCYLDEIRIFTRERFKTSDMSGDEWRFARVLQGIRKGRVVFERSFHGDMGTVAGYAPLAIVDAMQDPKREHVEDKHLCFQPGCPNEATSEYEIIEEFGPHGERLHPDDQARFKKRRRFCQRHLRRGDAALEDSDSNYRVISGYGPDQTDWEGSRISESL